MDEENCLHMDIKNIFEVKEKEGMKFIQDYLKKLYNLWDDFGIDSKRKVRRAEMVWKHVQILMQDIFKEENELYRSVQEHIQDYMKKIEQLSKALSVVPKEITGPLVKREELLRIELEKLNEVAQQRLNSFQHLKTIELKYCKILGIEEQKLSSDSDIPSQNDLNDLEQRINALKEERDRRHKRFCLVKKDLTTILETTELEPETSFEKEILSGKDDFSLSDETLKSLEEALNKAQQRKAELESRKKELRDRLIFLWDRLKIDKETRTKFFSKHENCCLSILKSLEEEVEKYQLLRKANIHVEISAYKKDLEELWSKCCLTDQEKKFDLFYSSETTDEILRAHEVEVEKWQKHYKDIQHILTKISERQLLWDKLVVFENKATDPNRFKNRGGNLLLEEKERKMLQKELPKLENEIFHDIEVYEMQNKTVFMYNGEDFRIHVTNQWAERANQKENEKTKRHKQRLAQIENESILKTPLKRTILSTPKTAPCKALKCNERFTPFLTETDASPMRRNLFGSACKSDKKDSRGKLMHGLERQRKTLLLRTPSYSDFIGELNTPCKLNYQSSILMEKNKFLAMQQSNKTPNRNNKIKSLPTSEKKGSSLTPTRGKLGLPFIL
ncbi:protein regulator of cytokinesis 1 [Nephila pilipes]|uniref:Protein regulator of cytokinesis 1 n=1 Tax=Nephila pilipes TaxID=299642 RepID=A0A8X6PXE1_NEPPI|nr:protein regulator of cytokinesis 1 [Nephila pilipes]